MDVAGGLGLAKHPVAKWCREAPYSPSVPRGATWLTQKILREIGCAHEGVGVRTSRPSD